MSSMSLTNVPSVGQKPTNLLFSTNKLPCPCISEALRITEQNGCICLRWQSEAETDALSSVLLLFHVKKKNPTKMNNENAFVEMEIDHCMIMPCYQWIKYFENSKSRLASSEYLAFLYRKTTKINFVFKPTRFCQKSSPGNLPFCYCVFFFVEGGFEKF